MERDDFNLTISQDEVLRLAPAIIDTLRELVGYGLCRQANTYERKSLAEKYAQLALKALDDFPDLKLNYCNTTCKTIVADGSPAELLAALQSALGALETASGCPDDEYWDEGGGGYEAAELARAAIAKAKGQAVTA
jgi:hypothetical protein